MASQVDFLLPPHRASELNRQYGLVEVVNPEDRKFLESRLNDKAFQQRLNNWVQAKIKNPAAADRILQGFSAEEQAQLSAIAGRLDEYIKIHNQVFTGPAEQPGLYLLEQLLLKSYDPKQRAQSGRFTESAFYLIDRKTGEPVAHANFAVYGPSEQQPDAPLAVSGIFVGVREDLRRSELGRFVHHQSDLLIAQDIAADPLAMAVLDRQQGRVPRLAEVEVADRFMSYTQLADKAAVADYMHYVERTMELMRYRRLDLKDALRMDLVEPRYWGTDENGKKIVAGGGTYGAFMTHIVIDRDGHMRGRSAPDGIDAAELEQYYRAAFVNSYDQKPEDFDKKKDPIAKSENNDTADFIQALRLAALMERRVNAYTPEEQIELQKKWIAQTEPYVDAITAAIGGADPASVKIQIGGRRTTLVDEKLDLLDLVQRGEIRIGRKWTKVRDLDGISGTLGVPTQNSRSIAPYAATVSFVTGIGVQFAFAAAAASLCLPSITLLGIGMSLAALAGGLVSAAAEYLFKNPSDRHYLRAFALGAGMGALGSFLAGLCGVVPITHGSTHILGAGHGVTQVAAGHTGTGGAAALHGNSVVGQFARQSQVLGAPSGHIAAVSSSGSATVTAQAAASSAPAIHAVNAQNIITNGAPVFHAPGETTIYQLGGQLAFMPYGAHHAVLATASNINGFGVYTPISQPGTLTRVGNLYAYTDPNHHLHLLRQGSAILKGLLVPQAG